MQEGGGGEGGGLGVRTLSVGSEGIDPDCKKGETTFYSLVIH